MRTIIAPRTLDPMNPMVRTVFRWAVRMAVLYALKKAMDAANRKTAQWAKKPPRSTGVHAIH